MGNIIDIIINILFSSFTGNPRHSDYQRLKKTYYRMYKNFKLSTRITLLAVWSVIISSIVSNILTVYYGEKLLISFTVILMASIAFVIAHLIAMRMSNPLKEMVEVVTEVEKGNLDVRVKNVDSGGPEMRKLSDSLNNMLIGLRSKERLEGENIVLEADQISSRLIQDRLLPRQLPSIPGYDIYIDPFLQGRLEEITSTACSLTNENSHLL